MVPGEYLHDEQDDEEYSFIVFVVSVVSCIVFCIVSCIVSCIEVELLWNLSYDL